MFSEFFCPSMVIIKNQQHKSRGLVGGIQKIVVLARNF